MTDRRAALLQAVIANPADDDLRLILADWLEDHGQQERSEFIRVQCRLAEPGFASGACACFPQPFRGKGYECEFHVLQRREREIFGDTWQGEGMACTNGYAWSWEIGDLLGSEALTSVSQSCAIGNFSESTLWQFRRGFIAHVSLTLADLLAHGGRIAATCPVERVVVTDRMPCPVDGWRWLPMRRKAPLWSSTPTGICRLSCTTTSAPRFFRRRNLPKNGFQNRRSPTAAVKRRSWRRRRPRQLQPPSSADGGRTINRSSTMSLFPSNLIAAQSNPGRTPFPNLARLYQNGAEYRHIYADLDVQILEELTAAGIPAVGPCEVLRKGREVPTAYTGEFCRWGFRRAWYYWVAEGPGIPADKAQDLWLTHGKEVRVEGHCGCPSPLEWNHGFATGMYHVDTAEGLRALAELLKSIYIPPQE